MVKGGSTIFNPEDYLTTPEAVAEYLKSAFESGNTEVIADALGVAARAHGMADVAEQTGLSRQSLYRSLSPTGRPELATVLKVVRALGISLTPSPIAAAV